MDYVTFRILPENRYGACVCSEEEEEMVADGPLDQLLEHLPSIKDQIVKGSCDNFILELPNSVGDRGWFTKTTLTRFLQIINSPHALKKSISICNELSQLEETRKFHLSLYTQADRVTSSDNSKNELLRAMDSRIAALTEELVSTFNVAAGAALSYQEMNCLQEFCQYFGDVDVKTLLLKLSERSQKGQNVPVNNKKSPVPTISKSDYENKINAFIQTAGQTNSLKPVQYNASPAKAAELERQSSTGSDDSSFSSEDDRPSATERSRTLVRSASPRRSASPMRKVQIGRSGSRRTPALTIKSLTHFPARDKTSSYRDTCEESDEPTKKTEINVTRMSVQDAISLFERKQRDQTDESQKKTATDNSTNPNKAVLRRWSSGMSESQKSTTQDTMEHNASENNTEDENVQRSAEVELDAVLDTEDQNLEENMGLEGGKTIALSPSEDEGLVCQTEETFEKVDSAEWNRQKEEELNRMLMKFAEYSMSNRKMTEPDNKKNRVSRLGQSDGANSDHKGKKDEKMTREKSGKRVEKQTGIRPKQRVPEKPKPEKSTAKASDIGKKLPASRTLSANKNSPVSSNSKKESIKPAVPKKVASRSSSLPATRKSWPSTPSPRMTETLPTKSPTITTSVPRQKSQSLAPRQKPQSPVPVSRPSPKLEKPQLQQKDVKKQQIDTKKNLKKVDDSKSRMVPKSGRSMIKTMAPEEDAAAVNPAKAVVRKKVTKKSSVVPLEVKPSVRKVSEKSPAKILEKSPAKFSEKSPAKFSEKSPTKILEKSPAKNSASRKREILPQAEETLSKSEDPLNIADNVGNVTLDTVHLESEDLQTQYDHLELEIETEAEKPEDGDEKEIIVEAPPQEDGVVDRMSESPAISQIPSAQESLISPAAWEESNPSDAAGPSTDSTASSLPNPDTVDSGTRVRHSLSQMLLEETSEPDIIEWGNAEHPPSMVYQKDAPKGFKRLLKFARKNKEANGGTWASPYTSEGEDDGDEYKNLGKRNSDNLLKVALHSKNYAEGFLSDSEPHSARSNTSNSSARSSNKFQDGHASSRGTRSFFSLSAFRGKN
ncbi:serine/arginine repetitive matrix protein 1-like [Chenopodium quinoa]|uniref:COP1-interacting protein 7 n=1 Tax=Chenopodium quinoa TaxID=63459 RepID=A0A803MMQ7_CHEQI|nr:serine/arginine repetitive matrix protein 1-like [Chenopodium quinoa]XP_021752485.1 serine/arginine repetitive matrix protein 1-like [Chenopodium quinoa]